jgi:membrane fusion protein, multidrug efflux system
MAAVEPKAEAEPDRGSNVVEIGKRSPAGRSRRRSLRLLLLVVIPLVALAGAGWMYLTGGRYVSTDNAYARAAIMNVTNDISGIVKEVDARENQSVKKDDVLFRLDEEPFKIALAGAEAQLGAVRNELVSLKATYQQDLAQIQQAKTQLAFAETAFERAQTLVKRGVTAQAALDQARRDRDTAQEQVAVAQRAADAILSQLGGDPNAPIDNHPRVRSAQAAVDRARWDLDHTTVVAPWPGTVANVENLKPGTYLAAGTPALSLVASDDIWIEANPKETDLTYVKPGDPATVTVDAYPGLTFKAKVASVSPATGAEFSVLPPQNASGNWVKVVQRVPLRLSIEQPEDGPKIRAGMSANVEIDTGHQRSIGSITSALASAAP